MSKKKPRKSAAGARGAPARARPAAARAQAPRTRGPRRRSRTAPREAGTLAEAVLATLEREGTPMTPLELAESLGVDERGEDALSDAFAALESTGQVVRNRAGSLLVGSRLALVAGRIEGHSDGHGFLRPDDGGPQVYLSSLEMARALHGDRATVRPAGRDSRGRPAGALVEVFPRAERRVVGRLHEEHGVLFLVPEDRRIAHDILVPPADRGEARAGQVVTVELVAQPSKHAQPIGRVREVVGEEGDAGIEIEIAVRKFELPHLFSRRANSDAAAFPVSVPASDLVGRRDLRGDAFVTIDGETARDFDDAVHCVRDGKGFRLSVAIADVSHYVRDGGALDIDAHERGTSAYFPRRVIPMLPEALSNELCSLREGVDRLVMVCEMAVTPRGEIARYAFFAGVIRSQARLTYNEVWAMLEAGKAPEKRAALFGPLQTLHEVYRRLADARAQRGAIDFDTVETRMEFDARGRIARIVPEVRNDAHRLIEECMLAANVCAGQYLASREQPILYRVHDTPSPEKVGLLRDFLAGLGLQLPGGDVPRPKDYAALLEKIRKRPDFALLQSLVLRSMRQAVYSPDNAGHFGLAFDAYAHFTSPIRRYPDLLVHRALKACLAGRHYVREDWSELGRHCSDTERRADEASRDVESWLKCDYMKSRVGEVFAGTITGVVPFGLFVTLDSYFVDGLVHISELGRDYFQFDAAGHVLVGERTGQRFRLADRLEVKLVRVDLESRKIDLVPA